MIPVTKPYLPKIKKYQDYVNRIFDSGWLTNNGSLLQELERRLKEYLGVKHIICVANGSLALQIAYKVLELKGEVISTPFSFAATSSTLSWEGLTPVFADIQPDTFNLEPNNIGPLITKKTSAIVPVHVFGNPCEVEVIQNIAESHDLKIIYDAAHAFDVNYVDSEGKSTSVLNYGNISTLSFHSTKLFHTIEGGAIITNDDGLAQKIRMLINFGISGPNTIGSIGTNAKMNEFEAAMGLCVLDEIDIIKADRKRIWETYYNELIGKVGFQIWNTKSNNNNSYAPVLFDSEAELLKVESKLKKSNIVPRRYFYPSLDTLSYTETQQICNVSRNIASRILCLPIYSGYCLDKQYKVIDIIKGFE